MAESIKCLQDACTQSPNEPTYHNNLGLSYFENEEFDAALTSYETAIKFETELIKKDPDRGTENLSFYHKNLGLAYYHQGNMEDALEQYEKAISHNPMTADNYFNKGNVMLN